MATNFKISDSEKIQFLRDLVAFKSVNNHELEVAKYIQKKLAAHSIDSKLVSVSEDRSNLVAEIGSGKPVVAISGHMDVVSEVDAAQWDSDPFTVTEKDDKLYGRGAADMKSGLAAMVTALIELKENGLPKRGTVRFMATVGEEVGGYGAEKLTAEGYAKDIDALIIGEPSGHTIIYAHRGSMDIRLTSKGEVAHSSMPEKGYNALNPLLEILAQAKHVFESATETNAKLGRLTYNTTILKAGDQVNSIPGDAVAEMNARTVPEYPNAKVQSVLQKLVDFQNNLGANVKMDVYMSEEPVFTDPNSRLSDLAQQIAKEVLGVDFPKQAVAGTTDASNFLKDLKNPHFPFMMFGPGNYQIAHQINEYVDKAEYLKFSEVYVKLLEAYLADDQA